MEIDYSVDYDDGDDVQETCMKCGILLDETNLSGLCPECWEEVYSEN